MLVAANDDCCGLTWRNVTLSLSALIYGELLLKIPYLAMMPCEPSSEGDYQSSYDVEYNFILLGSVNMQWKRLLKQ